MLYTLPEHEEMLARLMAVNDEPHLCERFYPLLLKKAGRKLNPQGVVVALSLAISDYTAGMPPLAANVLFLQMDEWIDALVPDAEFAQRAKDFYAEVMKSAQAR